MEDNLDQRVSTNPSKKNFKSLMEWSLDERKCCKNGRINETKRVEHYQKRTMRDGGKDNAWQNASAYNQK